MIFFYTYLYSLTPNTYLHNGILLSTLLCLALWCNRNRMEDSLAWGHLQLQSPESHFFQVDIHRQYPAFGETDTYSPEWKYIHGATKMELWYFTFDAFVRLLCFLQALRSSPNIAFQIQLTGLPRGNLGSGGEKRGKKRKNTVV